MIEADLRSDAKDIQTLLTDAVDIYLHSRGRAPDDHPPVTRVELAFSIAYPAPPYVSVDFDVRPDAEADGDATHRSLAMLRRPAWRTFLLPGKETVRLTFPDGSRHEVEADDVDRTLADFLVLVARDAHARGAFDRIASPRGVHVTVTYEGCPV